LRFGLEKQEASSMQLPLQITFHELAHSNAMAAYVQKHALKLDTFYDRIMQCRVAIEAPHRHPPGARANVYRVRIALSVPRDEIVVSREVEGSSRMDIYAALDAAFDDVQRRLQDHVRRVRGDVKRHDRAQHGIVSKLFAYEGYGFLLDEDGDEIYFHRNSVLHHGFDRMQRGSRVRFTEATGDDGVHASTVVLLPHRRPVAAERYR
jgi:cold shock CspA family protein